MKYETYNNEFVVFVILCLYIIMLIILCYVIYTISL